MRPSKRKKENCGNYLEEHLDSLLAEKEAIRSRIQVKKAMLDRMNRMIRDSDIPDDQSSIVSDQPKKPDVEQMDDISRDEGFRTTLVPLPIGEKRYRPNEPQSGHSSSSDQSPKTKILLRNSGQPKRPPSP